ADARPARNDLASAAYHVVPLVLRAGRAGVIGQDAHPRAHGKLRQPLRTSGAYGNDSMLLARIADDEIGMRPAIDVAYDAISLVDRVTGGAAIAGQRHPSAVDENPAFFRFVPDHGGENRQGEFATLADADPVHDEIEEHEHARTCLGDAGKVARKVGRRCRAEADD